MPTSPSRDQQRSNEDRPFVIAPESAVPAILSAIEGLRFGNVTVTVQDGRVLQIDRTERLRLDKPDQFTVETAQLRVQES